MKLHSQEKQFHLPFSSTSSLSETLDKDNRWYQLAELLPWSEIEQIYTKSLKNKKGGAGNKPARMIIGALIIKHKMNLSDQETIQTIRENPYMQYFVGLDMFTNQPIFDSSLFVSIRKRLDVADFNEMTLGLIEQEERIKKQRVSEMPVVTSSSQSKDVEDEDKDFTDPNDNTHSGTMKIDASCCDAEVRYPTDLDLLNDTREQTSKIVASLYKKMSLSFTPINEKKARIDYLTIAKMRRKPKTKLRAVIERQLSYIGRNIQSLVELLAKTNSGVLALLKPREQRILKACLRVYYQQKDMFSTNSHRCKDRIISIFQPHVRPIVRGKSKAKTEFGAKIGVCVTHGYTFIDHLSWDAYNESEDLQVHIDLYKERFGYLPTKCYADKIYLNRKNQEILNKNHIKIGGKPLGRPQKKESNSNRERDRERKDAKDISSRNEVEATFGTAKRVYRANNIKAKLDNTADVWTSLCFFVKNVMKFLKGFLFAFIFGAVLNFKRVKNLENRKHLEKKRKYWIGWKTEANNRLLNKLVIQ